MSDNVVIDPEKLEHGFSPLHSWMRIMEQMLNIAYRLKMKEPKWRVGKSDKAKNESEIAIREKLKEQFGLRLNEARPGGGNSNCGNTGRKFFEKWSEVAEVTGLDPALLEKLYIILITINCKEAINLTAFELYLEDTRKLYVDLYDWYPMSPTLHRVLVHGAAITAHTFLPPGMYSEEPLETRNKSVRNYREHHARKCSREANFEDVFNRLMVTSDPKLSLQNRVRNTATDFPDEVQALLYMNE